MIASIRNSVVIIFLFLAFSGCKDEEQPEPEKALWQEISHFKGRDKILLNSLGTEDALYFYGVGKITVVTDQANSGEYSFKDWAGFRHTDILYKPLLREEFFLDGVHEQTVHFIPTKSNWGSSLWGINFDLSDLNSTIKLGVDDNKYWNGEFFTANEAKQILIPMRTTGAKNELVLASLDMPASHHIEDVTLKHIILPTVWYYTHGVDDYFLISVNGGMYKLDYSGNYEKVSSEFGVKHLVKYDPDTSEMNDDFLLGITEWDMIGISSDDGASWNYYTENTIDYINNFQLVNLDGKILGYHSRYGIIHLDIMKNSIEVRQINTEGITNEITSLSKFKNDYIVTTFSGAFKKTASDFYTYID